MASRLVLLLVLALLLAAFLGLHGAREGPRLECFCVYYGDVDDEALEWLRGCDVAVLPPGLPGEALRELHGAGVRVLGYISAATLGGWEPWAARVPGDIVGRYETPWGDRVVDACSPEWQRVFAEAVDEMLSQGYDGVFIDNLDMADLFPELGPCLATLVRSVKTSHPGAVVAVNRGFTLLEEIAGSIDYLVFEDYATIYNPENGSYRLLPPGDLEWEKRVLNESLALAERHGFQVILLAYAPGPDAPLAREICRQWSEWGHGLPLYIAPGELDKPGYCNPCTRETAKTLKPRWPRAINPCGGAGHYYG